MDGGGAEAGQRRGRGGAEAGQRRGSGDDSEGEASGRRSGRDSDGAASGRRSGRDSEREASGRRSNGSTSHPRSPTYVADGVEGVAFLVDLLRGHAHLLRWMGTRRRVR